MAKQGPKTGEIPTQVIPLPDPPSDCGSAVMSDGSLTASIMLPDHATIQSEYTDIEMQRLRHLLHEPTHHAHSKPPSVLKSQSLKYKTKHADSNGPPTAPNAPASQQPEHPESKKRITFIEPEKPTQTQDNSTTDRSHSDDDTRSKGSSSSSKQKRCCGLCSPAVVYTLFGIAITATIVAVGINLLLYFDRNGSESSAASGTTTHDFTNGTSPIVPPNDDNPEYSSIETMMRGILENQFRVNLPTEDPLAPTNRALKWLVEEAQSTSSTNSTQVYDTLEKFGQRFALLVMRYALPHTHSMYTAEDPSVAVSREAVLEGFDTFPQSGVDECEWDGISCSIDGIVTNVDFSDYNLTGTIPSEIKFLANLKTLDLSNNGLQGTLPESMYGLQDLQKLYLYHNEIGGTLSRHIGRWDKLEVLHLSRNKFVGPIPQELQSDEEGFRPLKYMNLYDNGFSGTIPRNLRLRDMWYFDIGRNRFVGEIPEDLGEKFVALRYLHIDHNRLSGTIPETIPPMANGRLFSLLANHNYLSGRVPDNWQIFDKLTQFTLHENDFDSLGPQNCQFNVFAGIGNLVEFTADCDICGCNDVFCDRMCGRTWT